MKRITSIYTVLIWGLLLLIGHPVQAQQDSQYTQYMYNHMSVNPGYAGSRGSLSILGLYRNQWVGLEGAPETLDFSLHSPLGISGLGAGAEFYHDKIGPSIQSEIAGSVSYAIPVNDRGLKLSFGLRGGISLLSVDPNRLTIYDPNDYDLRLDNFSAPVFGAGVFLYRENWYVGLSTPNMLKTEYYDDVQVSTATSKAHFYLTGGYVFNISDQLDLKPAAMVKAVSGAPLSVDVSLNARMFEHLILGAAYRWDAAWSALAGFQISNHLMIGYAYDWDTTSLGHYNDGSHEVFLRFELGTRLKPKVNPRFF